MSILEEIKSLFEKELKKYKKITKAISDKYKEISEEHELLLADVEALDTRLIYVEKKLEITDTNEIYNNSTNNIKDISEFRYQIITRSKAKQLRNKQKLNKSEENEEQNSSDNVVSEGKRSNENSRKKNQRKKTKSKSKGKNKNKRNYSNKNNHENNNKEEFNKFFFNDNNKLEKTYNGINPLLIQDNNSFYNNNNNNIENNNSIDAMSFKNNNININETNSLLSTSENFSEFSFNPQKHKKKNNNIFNPPLPKKLLPTKELKNIITSDIIKSIEEIELILKSVHNYNKFDDIPTIQAIFQSSLNGDSAQTFHKFCDGEPNVIVVIESNKGNRFGGFTTIGFNSDNEVKKDYHAFLFSFDLMKIYKSKSGKKNIYCKENFGPCFGDKDNKDLMISDKCSINDSFVGKCNGCFINMNQDYEINKGNSNFIVNKLEIFKLLI